MRELKYTWEQVLEEQVPRTMIGVKILREEDEERERQEKKSKRKR